MAGITTHANAAVKAKTIESARLILVPLDVQHAGEMATVLADPALYTFTGDAPLDRQALHARYTRLVAGSPDPNISWCNWVIRLRDQESLTGAVQATVSPSRRGPIAEVAWVVGTPWQGQGIATEAAFALVTWLGRHHVCEVIAHVHPDHGASAAVAAAAGLIPGTGRQAGEIRWCRKFTK